MGIEKEQQKKTAAEIEKQKLDQPIDMADLEDEKDELLLRLKKMIDQGAARLEFKKGNDNEAESVTITRTLTGEMLFYANNETWTGQEDIKRIMELINKGQSD